MGCSMAESALTMTEQTEIRKRALRLCYESGIFDTAREVDANPNHPIVRAAWDRAASELTDGETLNGETNAKT